MNRGLKKENLVSIVGRRKGKKFMEINREKEEKEKVLSPEEEKRKKILLHRCYLAEV